MQKCDTMLVVAMLSHIVDESLEVIIMIVPTGAFKGSAFRSIEGEFFDALWGAALMMG